VLQKLLDPTSPELIATSLFDLLHAAELLLDSPSRLAFRDAGPPEIGDSLFDVEAEFLVQVGFVLPAL
jgi:hypothetical protein